MNARESTGTPESRDAAGPVARYVMVGGFLGAGKTTTLDAFARTLTERGLRVGLITNDQSSGLVDTAVLRARGHAVEEIAGGCFCCRFPSLQEAAERLTEDRRPDVFLAEPVGSCTDLVATVSYPLRRIYGDRFRIAPLSVLVDPGRAARILGLAEGRSFSPKVVYVYLKQLEEADLIVVNKCDAVEAPLRDALVDELARRFPQAEILLASAKSGDGMEAWLERVISCEASPRQTMELDYATYAEGEACLGWLNATYALRSEEAVDGNEFLLGLAESLRGRLEEAGAEIAHLKMTLDGPEAEGQLAVVSVVGSERAPDLRESLLNEVTAADLILNLRAERDPEELSGLVAAALASVGTGVTLERVHEERFRPAPPKPTHRVAVTASGRIEEAPAP